ncbi:hypothetical protein [Undibacterium sp. TS12]|uniref:hypothetical protein n=1 Tax=Undibacterium sp. TS12 TaxID=2908202 RepID=UPI001F4C8251|nr:hypothetical protein [Undibacterium sp. TS12]MCH8622555.1 hypothetical protein [Undibacterium sp. TS12]
MWVLSVSDQEKTTNISFIEKAHMHQKIRNYLATLNWSEEETPPVVDFHLYFSGNSVEDCIAPNEWGFGRPSIAELYARFKEIAAKPDVEKILVGLHTDWNYSGFVDDFPPAENVHIFTSASQSEVEKWIEGMWADGVVTGWPYGKPKNAPEPSAGNMVFSVCWD